MKDDFQNEEWAMIYDLVYRGKRAEEHQYYRELVGGVPGAKALEIACGTGWLTLDLLAEGADVYGLDISAEMLKYLEQNAAGRGLDINGRFSRQSMVDFQYPFQFDLILIPGRSFLHLATQDEQIRALRNIRAHLNPGGQLILNFFRPSLDMLNNASSPNDRYQVMGKYFIGSMDEDVEVSFNHWYDIIPQVQYIKWRFDYLKSGRQVFTDMSLRWIYEQEFRLLLMLAGFGKFDVYGDFTSKPFDGSMGEMVWFAGG
ncbi:MAG: class I SAM-dependent methyltransferase [Brevinematales bacterium]|nr:class I SAM-dependent methyltransferase [Brevinematales bacterium]